MKELMPELRFPEFEGEWEEKYIENVCKVTTGNKDTKDKDDNGTYDFFVRSDNVEKINTYSYDGEAILTSGDGVGVGKNFHYINGKFDFHQRVYCLHSFDHSLGRFVYYFFSTKFYQRVIRMSAKNSVDSVRRDMITKMPISIPTLAEQTKIADFLSAVDEQISLLTEKQEKLQTYKRGVMQKLFSQELRFKDEHGEDYPEWEEKKLGELCVINPQNKKIPESFVYIDLESVSDGKLLKENIVLRDEAPSRAKRVLEKKDILFQMVRPYQRNNLFFDKEGEYVASTGYAQIRTEQYPLFIFEYLHSKKFVDKVIERCTGTSYPAISSKDLESILILYPSISEQIKIADFLTAIGLQLEEVEAQIAQTKVFKQGLLQKMFV